MVFEAEKTVPIPNKDILSWTFDNVLYDKDEPIYIDAKDPSRTISARQALVIIRKLVAGFHNAGLSPGDCVCIHSFNDIMFSMLFLGIIGAGGIFAGTNPSYTPFELIHHIKTSQSRFLITEPEMLENALAAAKECAIPLSNIWVFNVHHQPLLPGFRSWEALMLHGEEDFVRFDDEKVSRETTAARLFSSGTTGLPKAVELSHYNLVAQQTLVHEVVPKPYKIRCLLSLPMFHAACVPTAHIAPLRSRRVSYVMRRFELEPFLENIEKFQINDISIVPPIAVGIVMSPATKNYSLRSLKCVNCGAAPMGKETQKRFHDLIDPEAPFTQVWGMTEASCIATMFYYPEHDTTGSVGRSMPNIDSKLIDDSGADITDYNVRGELCIRGPTIMRAYFNNAAANAASFDADGFFKTGDIAFCDSASRKWYIVDRKKELIKVRGFQIAPPEIEAVLLTHPLIIDAAVIGVPSSRGTKVTRERDGEQPRAYVVRRPGPDGDALTAANVKAFCALQLARYKELTGGVVFVPAIPKNATGKFLKGILREWAKKELGLDSEVTEMAKAKTRL